MHLEKIINAAICLHYFTRIWKEATIMPSQKRKKFSVFAQSRRPVIPLDIMCKVTDKIIYAQIYPSLRHSIPNEHFALLPGRNKTLQLLRLKEHVSGNFKKRACTEAIYLALYKADDVGCTNYMQLDCRNPFSIFLSFTLSAGSWGLH
jgi:hypothetical protein